MPRATYLAIVVITVIFAAASWAIVSGLGARNVVAQVSDLSSVDASPLADPAAVLFHVATVFVGPWLTGAMSWLVVSSLFAGLLAYQNCAARYMFALGHAGVLPSVLRRTNRSGAPSTASVATSVITIVMMLVFAVAGLDPVLNLFYWSAGVAVIAIVVEILVCAAVVVHFRRPESDGT